MREGMTGERKKGMRAKRRSGGRTEEPEGERVRKDSKDRNRGGTRKRTHEEIGFVRRGRQDGGKGEKGRLVIKGGREEGKGEGATEISRTTMWDISKGRKDKDEMRSEGGRRGRE